MKASNASVREKIFKYDDGSFDKKVEEVERLTSDKSERERMLTEWVLENLERFYAEEAQQEHPKLHKPLCFPKDDVPKKKRDTSRKSAKKPDNEELSLGDHRGSPCEFIQEEVDDELFRKKNKKAKLVREEGISCEEGGEGEEEGRKTKRPRNEIGNNLGEPPGMAQELKNRIERLGGTDLKLVIMKPLQATDLNPLHNRLSVPNNQKLCQFLTKEEDYILDRKVGKENMGINVSVIEPCGDIAHNIVLKKWNFQKEGSFSYNLINGWKKISKKVENNLNEKDIVQLWSFRVEGKLWFQLVKSGDGSGDNRQSSNGYGVEDHGIATNGDGKEENGAIRNKDEEEHNGECSNGDGMDHNANHSTGNAINMYIGNIDGAMSPSW